MEAEITLCYGTEREAEAVAEAVSPDNVRVPPGLTVRTAREGARVVTVVRCEKGLETLMSTIDDLLMAVQVAEKAVAAGRSP